MNQDNRHTPVFLVLFFSLLFLGCSEREQYSAPFFDGLYVEYTLKGRNVLGLFEYRRVYEMSRATDGFELIRYRIDEEKPRSEDDRLGGKVINVDPYGRIKKERSMLGAIFAVLFDWESLTRDEFSPIWIPVEKLEAGGEVFGGSILEQRQWRDWDVYVVKAKKFNSETYYDSGTGYVVGMISGVGGKSEMVLMDTNAELTVVEGF